MKRLLVLTAAACLLGATPPVNYNAFGINVLHRLATQSQGKNVFISPVSLGVALAMAADGAAGSTRTAMLHTLGIGGENLGESNTSLIASLESNHDAQIGIANALWLRQDIPPRPQYVSLLAQEYRAQAQALHFGDPSAAAAINDWTKAHTLGLIPQLVTETSPLDFLYLTNAIAFVGDWTAPFDPKETGSKPFTDASGTEHNVQMMSQTADFELVTEPSFRMLRMPYGSGGYAAYVLLPNAHDVTALSSSLSATSFGQALRALRSTYVAVLMPRFTAQYRANLDDVLASLGMATAFGQGADFSAMTNERVRIANVVHESYVRVDEKGTTAAAATSAGMRFTSIRLPETPPFVVDHPFIFAIRDEHTGALLFIGIINSVS